MRRAALVAVLGVIVFATAGCLAAPGDTSRITLVSSSTADGWQFDSYRNLAYPCSISGFQTFTVATKVGASPTATAPLWVYMHGGGAGFFDATGTPQPDTMHMTEENPADQQQSLLNPGLPARVRADANGYRMVAVSYCNRDIYGGTGGIDPHNPNPNADGSARTTNGMLATKAAIAFTESKYPTSTYVLHGGSAGSVGAYAMGWAMQESKNPPAGVVADASVVNVEANQAAYAQGACTKLNLSPAGEAAIAARVDPDLANVGNEVDKLVASGRLTVPLLNIWNHGDSNTCGLTTMTCPLRDGTTAVMTVTDCQHSALASAITALGPGAASANLGLCVSTFGNFGKCDKHVVTNAAKLTNTDPSSPADYLTTIMNWADARVAART